jgi:UDP-glucuronate 4-epimerase
MFLFTDAIINDRPIKVFNHGKMERDFTYVDDIVEGIVRICESSSSEKIEKNKLYKVYNIGNNNSVKLLDFIREIEFNLKKTAEKIMLPIQPGDVEKTWADVDQLIEDYDYQPNTSIKDGVKSFIDWFKVYYN